ncbi:hypothetical protein ACVOMV_29765 [Mesorhizobium atlanticum]
MLVGGTQAAARTSKACPSATSAAPAGCAIGHAGGDRPRPQLGLYRQCTPPGGRPGDRTRERRRETENLPPFISGGQIEPVNPGRDRPISRTVGQGCCSGRPKATCACAATGRWLHTAIGTPAPAMPALHPAYLLRTPAHNKPAWRDFRR